MTARISRETMAEQAYATLKAEIVGGTLQSGQRLLPHALSATLHISPTPVKEALLRLERDGLVVTESRRGVVVRRFGPNEITDLYGMRALLEQHAVRTGFAGGRIDPGLIAGLNAEQAALLTALGKRTQAGLNEALQHDRNLHALLVALSGNALMMNAHAQAMMQTHTVRVYTPASYTPRLLRAEHGAIIAALRSANEAASLAALAKHLDRSRADLLARMPLTPEAKS